MPKRSSEQANYWVWVFGEISALRWVVEHQRMVFAEHQEPWLMSMSQGDRAVLYTTRGAFHNPTRDEARFVGLATVRARPEKLESPERLGEREFAVACKIGIDLLLPERTGASVRDVVPGLDFVKKPHAWSAYFRRSPIRVEQDDFVRMTQALEAAGP